MAQDVYATGDGTTPEEVQFATNELTYAALRWHQLFENANVDARRINLQPLGHQDFALYIETATNLLKKPNMNPVRFTAHVNDLLRAASYKALGVDPTRITDPQVSDDYHQRLVTLLTMGACEYHGSNARFADSIRAHGLDPQVKQYDADEIGHIDGLLRKAGSDLGWAVRDQTRLSTTPDPHHALRHANISPEWFYLFTGGYFQNNPDHAARFHDTARAHVLQQLPHPENLSFAEQQQLLTFFDQYWPKLTTHDHPQLVMVPYFRDPQLLNEQIDLNLQYLRQWGPEKTITDLFNGDCYCGYEHVHDEPIDLTDAEMVELPTAYTISRQIERSLANAAAMEQHR